MAKSELLEQLAKKSPQYKAGVTLAILAVFGLLYYQFFYSSMLEERDSLEQRKDELTKTQSKLAEELTDKKRLAEQNEELQRTIRDNQRALPTEAELPSFFDHLQRKAGDAGVSIRRWDRRKEKSVDMYIQVPVEVEITGTFHAIMRYFSLLGVDKPAAGRTTARVDERIVSIEDLYLGEAKLKDGDLLLTAKFTASTFRQQEAAPAKPGKATAGGSAASQVKKATDERTKNIDKKSGGVEGAE